MTSQEAKDHGAVLTTDTEQFIIGQRVWVGGIRPGQIAFIGETQFAPGEWAGVVLDEPKGKNDGCVAGKRYFQCEPRRGIFSRLTRLTLAPLTAGAQTPISPERSRTVSPSPSVRSSILRSPTGAGKPGFMVGDRIIVSSSFGSRPGILRYLGDTKFATGIWCGVELDEPSGKNDGAVDGIRYFDCKPKYGVFVPIAKVSLSPTAKNSRMSRCGSRESLTSVGTINSVATTNTSRLRMSAQRKSNASISRPVTPKPQFSMQDILRERQRHIERLMIERDLDREDAQNQALQQQKNINELKARIHQLEDSLSDERKKNEDLQFSLDEATICGQDLNPQAQAYKDKILELETKIQELNADSNKIAEPAGADELAAAKAHIAQLEEQLAKQEELSELRFNELNDQNDLLQENIKYQRSQNELLRNELLAKDESLEKLSLSQCGIENLRLEFELFREESDKQSQQASADFKLQLDEKVQKIKLQQEELTNLRITLSSFEAERTNSAVETSMLRESLKARDVQVSALESSLESLQKELSIKQTTIEELRDQVKKECLNISKDKAQFSEQSAKLVQLKELNTKFASDCTQLQHQLKNAEDELRNAAARFEHNLLNNTQKDLKLAELTASLKSLGGELDSSKRQLELAEVEATKREAELKVRLQAQEEAYRSCASALESKQTELCAQSEDSSKKLKHSNEIITKLETEVNSKASLIVEIEARIVKLEQDLNARDLQIARDVELAAQQAAVLTAKERDLTRLSDECSEALKSRNCAEAALKVAEERIAALVLEFDDLKRKHEVLNEKCENLVKQNEDLKVELQANSGLQAGLEKLKAELTSEQQSRQKVESNMSAELLTLEHDLDAQRQVVAHEQKMLSDLKAVTSKLRDELSAKNTEINTLEEKAIKQELAISDGNRKLDNLQQRYDALVAQYESLQQELTSLRSSSTDSSAEMLKLAEHNVAKQKAFEELSERSSTARVELESQLQASQQRIDVLCKQVEALTLELKAATELNLKRCEELRAAEQKIDLNTLELNDQVRKLEALTVNCTKLGDEKTKLLEELAATNYATKDSIAKNVMLSEQIHSKDKQLEEQTTTRLSLEKKLQELQQRLQGSEIEAQKCRQEVVTCNEALEAANERNRELIGKLTDLQTSQRNDATKSEEHLTQLQDQLRFAEEAKGKLSDAVIVLQEQIKLLQEELQQAQLNFQEKEEQLNKRFDSISAEKSALVSDLEMLRQRESNLKAEAINDKAHVSEDVQQLKARIDELQSALELTQSEVTHREKLAQEDSQKIADLKTLIEVMKGSNAEMSATNAELSVALQLLETERRETSHIFELFEMESDHNTETLLNNLKDMKQRLADAQVEISQKAAAHQVFEEELAELRRSLQAEKATNSELSANFAKLHAEHEAQTQILLANAAAVENEDMNTKLAEYQQIIDEMDEAAQEKNSRMELLKQQLHKLELEVKRSHEAEQARKMECKDMARKLEAAERAKEHWNGISTVAATTTTPTTATIEMPESTGDEDDGAKINFLNSIIADMQNKHEVLKARIEVLEASPFDFSSSKIFEPLKRKPAPRLYCDICEEFDKHETEDCPLQDSEDLEILATANNSVDSRDRKLPAPRKYCESCEVFGHEKSECQNDETY